MGISPQRLSQLIDAQGGALVLYARQWCSTPEDVVQETFIKLLQQRRLPEPVVPWLYRVTRHGAISASRSEQRRQRRESRVAVVDGWFRSDDQRLDADTAAAALRDLPLELREPIVARIWGGCSFDDIALLTNVSAATAYRRYMQGLSLLRERMSLPCSQTIDE